jgi:transcriptional repressor NrdR
VSADTIESIASGIESRLYSQGRTEIESGVIGEMVMERLRALDDVAYVRFASVYRSFTDLEVLADEIDRLRESKLLAEERKRQLALGL